jgi:hypothetical protein
VWDFVIDKSGDVAGILVVSEALLLAGVTSPPPVTVAVLVTVDGAFAATLTVMVIGG